MTEGDPPGSRPARRKRLGMKKLFMLLPFYARLEATRRRYESDLGEAHARLKERLPIYDYPRQIRSLEKVAESLMAGRPFLPLPPAELRMHIGRVPDVANFLNQGLDSSRRVLEVFGEDPGGPVLDWGCGSGRTLTWLRGVGTWDLNWRGCDVDAEAIDWLRGQGVDQAQVCGELPPLPFPDASLAGLYCFSVLTHIPPDRHGAWYAEIARVLRPGGRAYVTVHGDENILRGKSFTDEEREHYFRTGWSWSEREGHHKHAATVSEAFTREAVGGALEIERYRALGYHSMDDLILRKR